MKIEKAIGNEKKSSRENRFYPTLFIDKKINWIGEFLKK